MAEVVPEPVRPGIYTGLPTAAGDYLVDPVRGHWSFIGLGWHQAIELAEELDELFN